MQEIHMRPHYDGMNAPANRIQIIQTDDPISKYAFGCKILEVWCVKVDRSSAISGSPSPSTTLKPAGIPNLGHLLPHDPCAYHILVMPLRRRLIEYELSNRDSKKYNLSLQVHWRLTMIIF